MTKATVLAKGTEMIISGFISKVDNNLVDFGWKKIKNVNNESNSHEQNIETRIYQVTVDAINAFTFDTYKNQDILYIAAESILGGFKSKKDKIEAVKAGLKMLESQIADDRCADFLGTLCDEICEDENNILYKEIVLMQNEQINEGVHEGFKRSEQNQKDLRKDIHEGFEMSEQNLQEAQRKLDYLVEKADDKETNLYSEIRIENRAEEYAAKWEKNVFLNDFNERDENAGINVKLKDIYLEEQLPHYIWKKNKKNSYDLRKLLTEYVVEKSGKKMLLILGQPGIGKSTLITWVMANFEEKKDDFLVYQFASDLKNVNWQDNNILSLILRMLNLRYDELENKVLILDGFDEIHANSDREEILNKLNQDLAEINSLKKFSLIITCRENYVSELEKVECNYVTLQSWDKKQIKRFCDIYGKVSKNTTTQTNIDKLLENKEIFGIPLILYMVLALEISIEKSKSLVDVYDQIFSIDRSSIYDRCIKNSRYDREHRISEDKIKQAIHHISQRISFWIFENNSDEACIPQKEYDDICNTVVKQISNGNEDIKRDFLIGNYFKLINHCDGVGTQKLQFIHRSLYEYFVVVYFFESLHNQTTKEEVAGKLGELLKFGHLSKQILEFVKYKFDKIKGHNLSNVTKETFQIMLRDGMTYHMKRKYKNIIVREMYIFANMLEVVHLWNSQLGKLDNNIVCYLKYNRKTDLNLRNIDLIGADLSGAYLRGAYLSRADLSGADLSGADLRGAYLIGADLRGADLSGADLSGAGLIGADLSGAYLIGADLSDADLSGADLSGADLSDADLSGADLSDTDLSGAGLIGADLSGAKLNEADLIDTVFDEKQVGMLHKKYNLSQSKVCISETK